MSLKTIMNLWLRKNLEVIMQEEPLIMVDILGIMEGFMDIITIRILIQRMVIMSQVVVPQEFLNRIS